MYASMRLWNRIQVVCSTPIVRKVICPYRPWALELCCHQSSDFQPPFNADVVILLSALEGLAFAALYFYLFQRPAEGKANLNPWEKLLVEVRKVNAAPMQRIVTWGTGLLAAENLVHRLKNPESQRGVILKNVAKRIGSKDAIRNVTCWIQPGTLVTILGPRGYFRNPLRLNWTRRWPSKGELSFATSENSSSIPGCGKTVLLKLIGGRMAATEGMIVVDGKKMQYGPNPSIGFLPDVLQMSDHSSVAEFLTLFCSLRGVHLRWAHRQIDLILKMFLMKDKKHRYTLCVSPS